MPRKGARITLEPGICRDDSGHAVRVKVGDVSREKRYPLTVDRPYLRLKRAEMETEIRGELQQRDPEQEPVARGTLAGDVIAYLKRVKRRLAPGTYRSRVSELKAWTAILGHRPRHLIRLADVERVIDTWRTDGVSPKTMLNRVRSLRHLYVVLDGKRARTPADDLKLPKIVKQRPRDVDVKTVRTVIARLIKHERAGKLRDAKTRARFLVRITSGQRPVQIMKTEAADVNLKQRQWRVPPAKGGEAVILPLNDDAVVAWTLFIAANAWGDFDTVSQARVLRRAGWPADVPIYNARHSVGIAFSEAGEDLGDIQHWLGHKHLETTRGFYVPGLFSRLKKMSDRANKRVDLQPRWARFVGHLSKSRKNMKLKRKHAAS